MRVPIVTATVCAAVALTACGDDVPPISDLCLSDAALVAEALVGADRGGPVALKDGTTIAQCVERAVQDADLQSLGVVLTAAADRLVQQAPTDPTAARRLGWLVGATQRGAARTNGANVEIGRRIGLVAGRILDDLPTAQRRALLDGIADGEARG